VHQEEREERVGREVGPVLLVRPERDVRVGNEVGALTHGAHPHCDRRDEVPEHVGDKERLGEMVHSRFSSVFL